MGSTVNGHDDLFIINDIELTIPPTAIKITKDSFNFQWQTLRTTTSQKTKSGHSTVTIEFTVPFVGFKEVNTKLRPLIAELRYMPFCFVENQFLRENLFPQEKQDVTGGVVFDSSTMVLAMRAISITARPDTPGTIWATFQFAYFNYLPYTPYWQYKADLFDEDENKSVTFPKDSNAWKKFVAPVVNKFTDTKVKPGSAKIGFLELRTAPTSTSQSLEETKQILSSISKDQKAFFDHFRKPGADTPDGAIIDAVKETFPQFQNLREVAAADLIGPLLVNAGPNSNPLSKRFKADGQYIDQNELKKALSEIDDRILTKKDIEQQVKNNQDGFQLVPELVFQDNKGAGYGVYRRPRELNLTANSGFIKKGLVIESITVSIQNILATIPIIGQRYATFQHIGSIDASVYMDIKVLDDNSMAELSWMYDTINDNMLNNRHIPQGLQTVRIDNDILALLNLQEFITQDLEVSTIEGSPGTYQAKLSFIESGLQQKDRLDTPPNEKFNIEFAASDIRVAREVCRILNNNITTKTDKQFLRKDKTYFVSNVDPKRAARFDAIVKTYIGFGTSAQILEEAQKISDVTEQDRAPQLEGGLFDSFKKALAEEEAHQPSATTISSTHALNRFVDDVSDMVFKRQFTTSEDFGKTRFTGDFRPAGTAFIDGSIKDSGVGDTRVFNLLMGMTEQDCPGITKVQEIIYGRAKQDKELTKELSSLVNKPFSDVLSANRDKVARGAKVDQIRREKALYQKINFDSTDLSFADTLTGASNSPPSTLEGERLNDLLRNSVDTLLTTPAFIRWNQFTASMTTAIIESDDIELPEFATAKKLISELRLGRGLPAYADFKLERILAPEDQENVDKILSLDPDCYLFTPTDTSANRFIDTALIANAKRTAQTSYTSALGQINQYYNDSWLPGSLSKELGNRVKANIAQTINEHGSDKGKSASPPASIDNYYQKSISTGKYPNAGITNTAISLGTKNLDPGQLHASTSIPTVLQVNRSLNHSLNPADLFDSAGFKESVQGTGSSVSTQTFQTPAGKNTVGKRGRPISKSTRDEHDVVTQTPDQLRGSLDLDVYCMARMIASECGNQNEITKTACAHAILNQCKIRHKTVAAVLIPNGTFGSQVNGRAASTRFDPHEDDLRIAQRVLTGQVSDPTGGAIQWNEPDLQDDPRYKALLDAKQGRNVTVRPFSEIVTRRGPLVEVPGTGPKRIVFFKPKDKNAYSKPYTPPTPSVAAPDTGITAGANVADLSIQAYETSVKNGQGLRMVRAFPAFKLYFIQDNSGNRRRYGLDDFFSYNSVVDITCVRSRKIPADLLELTLTNVSGVLSNRKFQGPRDTNKFTGSDNSNAPIGVDGKPLKKDPNDFLRANTNDPKNQLASMMLQSGVDVELRLGYANDPDKLSTVFVGKIMEVEFSDSDDLVRVICQSHAIELVQDIKGMAEPLEKDGFFVSDARTDLLLEQLMAEPEVLHFGRWIRSKSFNSDGNSNRSLLTNKYTLTPTPQDDNIFVPPIQKLEELDPGFFFKDIKYTMYQTTIWDVFTEMTLRHPGWVKSPIPYKGKEGPRMTMFFGLPSQLYFSSDPSAQEKSKGAELRKQVEGYNNNVDQLKQTVGVLNPDLFQVKRPANQKSIFGTNNTLELKPDALNKVDLAAERLRLAKDFQSIRPFRSYHLVTSKQHIISNNIRASAKGTHNTISIQYGDSEFNKDTKQLVQEGTDVLTLSIDAALPDEEVRELFAQYANCQSKLHAKNYATALLMRELKEVYRGELTVIGNPDIKPYDIVYIFDEYSDIMGPVEVEQVIHRFSQDTGFITEITPDLFVTANEWVNMTVTDMMSIIMEGAASVLTHGTPTTTETLANSTVVKGAALGAFALTLGAAPIIAILGAGAAIGGYFMMQKMVDFTSHGQPVVIHPLIHRGKPWIAGLPMDKLNNLWSTNKGQWFKEAFEGLDLWLDDFDDKLVLAVSQGSPLNLFSGSDIGAKF